MEDFFFAVVVTALLAVFALGSDNSQYHWEAFKSNISHPLTAGRQAISDYIEQVHKQNESQTYLTVDIDDLMDAYLANVNVASRQYDGKFVKITYARVDEIQTDSIDFKGNNDHRLSQVSSMNINEHDRQVRAEMEKVKKDDYVTVYGKIDHTNKTSNMVFVYILIDHIVPTPMTTDQLIQRASERAAKKLQP